MIAYLGSSFNQFYDSWIYPDSLMSSMFILSSSLLLILFNSTSKYINIYFFVLCVSVTYSISIRANGILLLPLVVVYLLWFFYSVKNKKQLIFKILLCLIPLFSLSLFNLYSPIYKVFSPIGFRKIMYVDTTGYRFENQSGTAWNLLTKIIPENDFHKDYNLNLCIQLLILENHLQTTLKQITSNSLNEYQRKLLQKFKMFTQQTQHDTENCVDTFYADTAKINRCRLLKSNIDKLTSLL